MSVNHSGSFAVRFQHPEFPAAADIERYFSPARDTAWYSNFGPCVRLLEERLSDGFLAGWPAVTSANATTGLMLALRAVFGDPGTRRHVVVPSLTFIASLSAIQWSGFTPLYVDVDAFDWQVSAASLDEILTTHGGEVAGVMLTTTFGTPLSPPKARDLGEVLRRHSVPAIVDAAAGLGGLPPCDLATAWVFSMHATKPIGIGEGGVVACVGDDLAARVRALSNFGLGPDRRDVAELGFNAKMSELTAAVALAALDLAPDWIASRREHARHILDMLRPFARSQPGGEESPRQFLPIELPAGLRRSVASTAARLSVETRQYFDPPLHRLACSRSQTDVSLPNTDALSSALLCLPLSARMSTVHEELVIRAVAEAFEDVSSAGR